MSGPVVLVALILVAAGVASAAAVLGKVLLDRFPTPTPRDAALPSHYSGLLYSASTPPRGSCPECGEVNDPEWTFCSNCSTRLPDRETSRRDRDLGSLLEK